MKPATSEDSNYANLYWASIILKRKKRNRNVGFIYESHLKVSKEIYIISNVNTEINNGTYWISNLNVKWCSDCHIQETKLNKLLPLTYIFEYYIQGSYWNKNLQFKFRCQQFWSITLFYTMCLCMRVLVLVFGIKKPCNSAVL